MPARPPQWAHPVPPSAPRDEDDHADVAAAADRPARGPAARPRAAPGRAAALAWLAGGLFAGGAAAQAPAGAFAPGEFDAVAISGVADVRFTQGPAEQVVVEGDEATRQSVTVELRGRTLQIRPSGSWRFWSGQRPQIAVTARQLTRVSISGAADWVAASPVEADRLTVSIAGSGNARFDQLQARQLNFNVSGAGDGRVAGRTDELSLSIAGRSAFDGEQLRAARARVSVSGIGNVKVWATESFGYSVAGVSTIDVWGSPPQVRRSVAGQAEVHDRGPKP
ncbi:head GIN domain-containing protein [Piscinibacter sakaiensis]|uniref:head GIN domain-containing protein n=1 Tax=Piscinibacter sakaiensis TaxID=1547922 RepID=UPI001E5B4BFE|nr:head GIN domain-containing protein [Piscinibacter sakaiensis]